MQEARDLIDLAAPYMVYILPVIFVLSFMAFADLILDFSLNIVNSIRKKMRFD